MYSVYIQTAPLGDEYKQVMYKSGTLYEYENKAPLLYLNLFPTELNGIHIKPTVNKIKVLDLDNNEVFWGRIINEPVEMIQSDGTFFQYITAEGPLNFLLDRLALKWEFHPGTYTSEVESGARDKPVILENQTVKTALTKLIELHYNGANNEEQIHIIDTNITVEDSVYFTTQRSDTLLSVIQNKIIKSKGGYMYITKDTTSGFLQLHYDAENNKVGPDIVIGKNILTYNRYSPGTPYYNRVTAIGEKGLTMTGRLGGGPVYVEDTSGVNQYGVRETYVEYPDVIDPNNLYSKADIYLREVNKTALSSFELQVLDTSFILEDAGYEISQVCKVSCGNIPGVSTRARIIEISRALESPHKVKLTLTKKSPSAIANNVDTELELQNLKSQIQSIEDRL